MLDVLRFEIIPCASQVHLPSMMHNNWKFLHYSRNMQGFCGRCHQVKPQQIGKQGNNSSSENAILQNQFQALLVLVHCAATFLTCNQQLIIIRSPSWACALSIERTYDNVNFAKFSQTPHGTKLSFFLTLFKLPLPPCFEHLFCGFF